MKSTKKLLSISNLKKYFPVAKSSIFQKEQLYVRANEDISIDIYEGETVGVVGESGCGKSTLGRVLLQLYPQTAGTTMYYGATLDSTTPKYVIDTLHHLDRYKARLEKASEKAAELSKKVMDAGGEENADFYLLQERNLALCDEQTCLMHIVTILGGFFAKDEGGKGRELMEKVYYENVKRNKLLEKRTDINAEYELSVGKGDSGKAAGLKAKLDELDSQIAVYDRSTAACQRELDDLRARNAANPEFAKYEAMRDSGIDLARLQYSEMRLLRKDLQIIFQDPYSSLNPRMTIGQIIEEGLLTHNFYRKGSKQMEEHILSTMDECGLQDYMVNRYPHQFSGGHCPGPGGEAQVHRVRRVRVRPGRVHPVPDHQPAPGAEGEAEPDLYVHLPRPVGGALYLRSDLCDVPGQHCGAGRRRDHLQGSQTPLHGGAALLHPHHRPGEPGEGAHSAGGQYPQPHQATLRLQVPYPLLYGLRQVQAGAAPSARD